MPRFSLLLPLFLCLLLSSCQSGQEPLSQPGADLHVDTPASATLLFTGDIMMHGQQLEAAERAGGKYDFQAPFTALKPLFGEADLVLGNLELTLPGTPPYRGYPTFRAPDALAAGLREAGFDLLTTANNHALDAGRAGLKRTAKVLREHGFYQTGTFLHERDRRRNHPLLVYVNELEIAFLNYCYPAPALRPAGSLLSTIDLKQIREDLRRAHRAQPHAIIVLLHWGEEYSTMPTPAQQELAQQLLRWGVDAVIGTHPHVAQPLERYTFRMRSGERKEKLVAWSLGNFISNQDRPGTDIGLALELKLEKDSHMGKARITDWQTIPIWRLRYREGGLRRFSVVPATPEGLILAGLDSLEQSRMQRRVRELQDFLDSTTVLQ